jgi:hypothetical protein
MACKFVLGDKVDQTFSNHGEGTIVAVLTDKAGGCRYAVSQPGRLTLQIVGENDLRPR